jgi:beta-galactosidase
MRIGVCYYPEHWPEERWPIDARMMAEAGISIVRIAEFAWSKMEPADGQFNWQWLDQAVETLAAEGLKIVMCTPTATPPAWLCKAYPEILPVDSQGRRRRFGSRRHYCSTNQVYRKYSARIVSAMAERYGRNESIISWQIDNEFGCHDTARCYCDVCAATFRRWLQHRYGTLDALNQAWGAVFWSQTYTDWEEIQPPNLTVTEPNPSHVLDYYRFSSDATAAYQQMQIDLLRKSTAGQTITTNFMGDFPDLDYHDLARNLDFVTWDSYPTGYAEQQTSALYPPTSAAPVFAYDVGDPYITGFCHDLTRSIKQAPFWVMEQQCGNINWASYNPGIRPGTVRLWTWHALASGADAVVYFRWRACRFAQEQYHSGMLLHDSSPAIGYTEAQAMLPEHELMTQVANTPWHADVALLLDYKDLWATQLQPHRSEYSYLRYLFLFYRALSRLGIQTDIVSPESALEKYRLVIAPTIFLVDEKRAEALKNYVQQGGTLLLGIRSGFKTDSNLVTDLPLPGLLRDLVGASVRSWHALSPGVRYDFTSNIENLHGVAVGWAEALEADPEPDETGQRTRVLANYVAGAFSGFAALTERSYGSGRVFYAGWYPTIEQANGLVAYLANRTGVVGIPRLPEGLIGIQRKPYALYMNFTDNPLSVLVQGKHILIEPRNLKVIKEPEASAAPAGEPNAG